MLESWTWEMAVLLRFGLVQRPFALNAVRLRRTHHVVCDSIRTNTNFVKPCMETSGNSV